jgi:hypothetical protein
MMSALEGKGRRPTNPYVRIMWAAHRGQGITLSADEVYLMSFDDAISTVASNVATDAPDVLDWLIHRNGS